VIDALADQLTPENVADHLDLPDNQRVQGVRRLRGWPNGLPASLEELSN